MCKWAICTKKESRYAKSWARTFWKELEPSISQFEFNEVSFISKNNYEGRVIPVLGYLMYYNNLEKLPSSVLIAAFGAFSYYSIMGSMSYFY